MIKPFDENTGFEFPITVVMKSSVWDITPCSPLKVRVVGFQQTTRRFIPEDRILHLIKMFVQFVEIWREGNGGQTCCFTLKDLRVYKSLLNNS
jgi:hypothetical protein